MQLPGDAQFLGFVIANDSEEYLAIFQHNKFKTLAGWAATPLKAKLFATRRQAEKAAKKLPGKYPVYVLECFDTENQLVIASDSDTKPHWLQ